MRRSDKHLAGGSASSSCAARPAWRPQLESGARAHEAQRPDEVDAGSTGWGGIRAIMVGQSRHGGEVIPKGGCEAGTAHQQSFIGSAGEIRIGVFSE